MSFSEEVISSLNLELQELGKIANDLHYKELPRFALRLARNCYLREDKFGFWYEMEKLLRRSLHLFSPLDLMTLKYAFTFKFPKLATTDLRKQIDKLVEDEFQLLSVDELLLFMMCQINNSKVQAYDLILRTVKERANEIISVAKERGPELLVNFFYAYCITRIPKHKRRTRGIEPDIQKEASQWLSLFDAQIRADFSKLSTAAVYRLAYSLEISGLKDVRELYWRQTIV